MPCRIIFSLTLIFGAGKSAVFTVKKLDELWTGTLQSKFEASFNVYCFEFLAILYVDLVQSWKIRNVSQNVNFSFASSDHC